MMRISKNLVTALKGLHVKRGDRVIIQMPNCPEVLQCFGAVWRLGATIVPINHLMSEEETAYTEASAAGIEDERCGWTEGFENIFKTA